WAFLFSTEHRYVLFRAFSTLRAGRVNLAAGFQHHVERTVAVDTFVLQSYPHPFEHGVESSSVFRRRLDPVLIANIRLGLAYEVHELVEVVVEPGAGLLGELR